MDFFSSIFRKKDKQGRVYERLWILTESFRPHYWSTLLESPCINPMCWCLLLFIDTEKIAPRRWRQNVCPLWVFLRSGLSVPKAASRKPLPQKVSAPDSGVVLPPPRWSNGCLPQTETSTQCLEDHSKSSLSSPTSSWSTRRRAASYRMYLNYRR